MSKKWVVYETVSYRHDHIEAASEQEAIDKVAELGLHGKLTEGSEWDVYPMEKEEE
jgi:hypothetical protein